MVFLWGICHLPLWKLPWRTVQEVVGLSLEGSWLRWYFWGGTETGLLGGRPACSSQDGKWCSCKHHGAALQSLLSPPYERAGYT